MKVETESGQHHFQVQAYLDTAPQSERPAPSGHGRNGAAAFMGANRVAVEHATLRSGDPCPERREGRVYRQRGAGGGSTDSVRQPAANWPEQRREHDKSRSAKTGVSWFQVKLISQ